MHGTSTATEPAPGRGLPPGWVPPEPINSLLERPLDLEAALVSRGGRIPAGLSLLAVFR